MSSMQKVALTILNLAGLLLMGLASPTACQAQPGIYTPPPVYNPPRVYTPPPPSYTPPVYTPPPPSLSAASSIAQTMMEQQRQSNYRDQLKTRLELEDMRRKTAITYPSSSAGSGNAMSQPPLKGSAASGVPNSGSAQAKAQQNVAARQARMAQRQAYLAAQRQSQIQWLQQMRTPKLVTPRF